MPADNPAAIDKADLRPDIRDSTHADIEVIKVLEERLSIVKQIVDSGGGLRLRKVIHADVVQVTEPLAIETLAVRRVSVDREVQSPVAIRYEGDTTVFPIFEERLVTRKQLVLVEEVHVSKLREFAGTSSAITLRREEVIVERQDPSSGEWSIVGADGV